MVKLAYLDIIEYAALHLETVLISYQTKKGGFEKIETEPYEFKKDKSGNIFYWAWNINKNHIAKFYPSRILFAESTGNPFVPRFPIKIGGV